MVKKFLKMESNSIGALIIKKEKDFMLPIIPWIMESILGNGSTQKGKMNPSQVKAPTNFNLLNP